MDSTTATTDKPRRCPTCQSPAPNLHPAVQFEGEVQLCRNAEWHAPFNEEIRSGAVSR